MNELSMKALISRCPETIATDLFPFISFSQVSFFSDRGPLRESGAGIQQSKSPSPLSEIRSGSKMSMEAGAAIAEAIFKSLKSLDAQEKTSP